MAVCVPLYTLWSSSVVNAHSTGHGDILCGMWCGDPRMCCQSRRVNVSSRSHLSKMWQRLGLDLVSGGWRLCLGYLCLVCKRLLSTKLCNLVFPVTRCLASACGPWSKLHVIAPSVITDRKTSITEMKKSTYTRQVSNRQYVSIKLYMLYRCPVLSIWYYIS